MKAIAMRDLVLERLKSILRGATGEQGRWTSFAEFVFTDILGQTISTKEGRKKLAKLKLDEVDYSVLADVELLELYEFAIRKLNTQR